MVALGVGKNMVRAIRFWSQAAGVATYNGGENTITNLGITLLGEHGLDPYLEDIRTLWLIHWNLSTEVDYPLLAWDFLLNRWQEPELFRSGVLISLHREATKYKEKISPVTLEQHFDTFLHTYVPTRGLKGEVLEDNLDCPLVELGLLVKVGERELDRSSGKREPIYVFHRDEKPAVSPELFVYSLNDFWQKHHRGESTLPLREIAHGHGSSGQIFKLPEEDIRSRVEALARQTGGLFTYSESAYFQQIRRLRQKDSIELLKEIYFMEAHD